MIRVLHTLPDLAVGGGQLVVLRAVRATRAHGVAHAVLAARASDGTGVGPALEEAGARVIVGTSGVRAACALAAREARSVGIVHTNNTNLDRVVGQWAGWRAGVPVVNTLHAEGPNGVYRDRGVVARARRWAERWLARRAVTRVIAVSEHVRRTWSADLDAIGVGPERVDVIHPCLELDRFAPIPARRRSDLRAELGAREDDEVIVGVARYVPGKGLEDLVRVLAGVRATRSRARLWLVGDGPLRASLAALASSLGVGDAVTLVGERGDVPDVLRSADVLAFASESEGFGLAPLEAMASELPAVAFALPSLAEFMDDGRNAVLIQGRDVGAMARAIAGLLGDPARGRALGAAGREAVEAGFACERGASRLVEVYRTAINDFARGRR